MVSSAARSLNLLTLGLAVSFFQVSARVELDKTPHPCKEKYEPSEISNWVNEHLKEVQGGHATPHMLLTLGGSGAGKGTLIRAWKDVADTSKGHLHPDHFVFHGLDEYLDYIPEYRRTIEDPEHVYKDAADACYPGAAIPAAKLAGKEIVERRINAIYEETGKSVERIQKRVLPQFVEAGYRITVVLVDNKADVAINRSAHRFQKRGRYASEEYIRGTFGNNFESYTMLRGLDSVAEAVYCDNSAEDLRCWADKTAADEPLLPAAMLLSGAPERLTEAEPHRSEL
mmetsp:Transcript_8319/g.18170  ORF Transcript_8319/g.18170 Transcript_8319/m.18170 type:complete len:285 (+) Transcript_8319:47-901(+)